MRALAIIFGIAVANISLAGVIPEKQRDTIIQGTLKDFWGNAKNSRGEFIQPASENDRKTVPVTTLIAYRALDTGEISGFAEWCGLDWQSHYFALTKSARSQGLNDKQVAFISVLHGKAQGMIFNAMKNRVCGDKERSQTDIWLKESKARGLNGT